MEIETIEEGATHGEGEAFAPPISAALVALSKAMLEECGLVADIAERFARDVPFETLREYVFAWRADPDAGVGALKHRIENNWRHSPLIESDYADAFYLKYRTPEEVRADQAKTDFPLPDLSDRAERPGPDLVLGPSMAMTPAASVPSDPLAETWQQLRACFLDPVTARWLRDTVVVAADNGEWLIAAPAYAVDWLQSRLRDRIQRQLSGLVAQPVSVSFEPIGKRT